MILLSLTSALGLSASCVMSNTSACFSGTGLVLAGLELQGWLGRGISKTLVRVILAYKM